MSLPDLFPPPRPFQVTAHESLRQGARARHRAQLICAPTGAGKSYLGLRVAYEAMKKDRRVVFMCDRTTLIDQTSALASSYGLQHGIIQSNHPLRDHSALLQIASAQTIMRRGWPSEVDVVIIDECHSRYDVWTDYVPKTKASVVGLSATPFSKGLGRLFSNLINAETMKELTRQGILVPLKAMVCKPIETKGATIDKKTGEWLASDMEERGARIVGDVVKEWYEHARGRKTIVFAASINHCKTLCEHFNAAGVPAAVFTAKTPKEERKAILDNYREPGSFLQVLISVEALAKGFDVPCVECIVDCRPLRKSFSTFMQMIGRGLRCSVASGKQDCLLLDHTGNIERFAKDYEHIFHHGLESLDESEKLDKTVRDTDNEEIPDKACPECGYMPFRQTCMSCGYERPVIESEAHVPGSMQEFSMNGLKNDVITKIDTAKELYIWAQCCAYARGYGKNPANAPQRAWHHFKSVTGYQLPKGMPNYDSMGDISISQQVAGKIKQAQIAYAKRMQKANSLARAAT